MIAEALILVALAGGTHCDTYGTTCIVERRPVAPKTAWAAFRRAWPR